MEPRKMTIDLGMALDVAFDRCRETLIQFGAKIKSEDRDQGLIKAEVGMSWKSFGEVVYIKISEQNSGHVSVQVSSSPKVKTTLVDFGKGSANVERITSLLTALN